MSTIEKAIERASKPAESAIPVPVNESAAPAETAEENTARATAADLLAAVKLAKPATAGSAPHSRQVSIDWTKLRRLGLLTPQSGQTPQAAEYRAIARPLLQRAFPKGRASSGGENLLLITSSIGGEGKTFTAINLGIYIAQETSKKVLLVDGNFIHPDLGGIMGVAGEPGLVELLGDPKTKFPDVSINTDIPNLAILPHGRPARKYSQLLSTDGMRHLLSEMAARYSDRIIIIDSPPLLSSPEVSALAKLAGQTVVVVESNRTSQGAVKKALFQLESCEIVACVLNKTGKGAGFTHRG